MNESNRGHFGSAPASFCPFIDHCGPIPLPAREANYQLLPIHCPARSVLDIDYAQMRGPELAPDGRDGLFGRRWPHWRGRRIDNPAAAAVVAIADAEAAVGSRVQIGWRVAGRVPVVAKQASKANIRA